MEIEAALKIQYQAGLDMLRLAIKKCPPAMWTAGSERRPFWRIVYHALFYTHWYLMTDHKDFQPWEGDEKGMPKLWEKLPSATVYSKRQLLDYCEMCQTMVDQAINAMDLRAEISGFPHYPVSKMEHQLVNLRHLQHHVGQLSERLLEAKVDVPWLGGYKE